MLVKLFYTCMCFLCNSRFKSSLGLMLCAIDISTLNKTYLIFDLICSRHEMNNYSLGVKHHFLTHPRPQLTNETNSRQPRTVHVL